MVTTAAKVNLKKYLAIDGKWQFVPVLKNADGKPEPSIVLIGGEPTKGRPARSTSSGASTANASSSRLVLAPVALAQISVICCGSSQRHL